MKVLAQCLVATCLILAVNITTAQMPELTEKAIDMIDRHTGEAISGTDTGRFQSFEDNVMLVPGGTSDSVVCRFRSANDNCYRLSLHDGTGMGSAVPVVLIDRATFDNISEAFREREHWGICEIIEDPWTPWTVVGSVPTAPGTHNYTEERYCSTGGVAEACPCDESRETRTQQITNVDNRPAPPPRRTLDPVPPGPTDGLTRRQKLCSWGLSLYCDDDDGGKGPETTPRSETPDDNDDGGKGPEIASTTKPTVKEEPSTYCPDIVIPAQFTASASYMFRGSNHDVGRFNERERLITLHHQASGTGSSQRRALANANANARSGNPNINWVMTRVSYSHIPSRRVKSDNCS